jgi:hypothetical protein
MYCIRPRIKITFLFLLVALLILLLAILPGIFAGSSVKAEDNCQLFSETGFSVCGRFLEYWKANGGLAQQGFPISNVFDEQNSPPPAGDGKLHRVQYFERARFEYHPENQAPYDVLLGLLGSEQLKTKYNGIIPASATVSQLTGDCQIFSETSRSVCGKFLEYWKGHGGLVQQGLPITAPFVEQNAPPPAGDGRRHTVQYFERARFELHDENQPPYDVLLGLLGSEQYQAKQVHHPAVRYNGLHWSNPGSSEAGLVYKAGQQFSAALVLALPDNGNDWQSQLSWIKANTNRTGDIVVRLYWEQNSLPDARTLGTKFYNQIVKVAVNQYAIRDFQVLNELNIEYEKNIPRSQLAAYMSNLAAQIKGLAQQDGIGPIYLGFPGMGGDSRLGTADISDPSTNLAGWNAYWDSYASAINTWYDWLGVHTYEFSQLKVQNKMIAQYDNLAVKFPLKLQRYTEYGGPVSRWGGSYQRRATELSNALKGFKSHVEALNTGPDVQSVFYYIANPSNDPEFELTQGHDLAPAAILANTF